VERGSGYCAVFHRSIELIGRRWNGVIVRALLAGGQRFSDVRSAVPGLSDRLLAERLRELEREGVVARSRPACAGGSCYSLTPKGQALAPVFDAVSSWASTWMDPAAVEVVGGGGRGPAAAHPACDGRSPADGSRASGR
jgi:DNA-binding HxlR family transcriptional regulator